MCERGWCSTLPIAARSSPLWNINYSNVKSPRYPSIGAQIQRGNVFPDQAVWLSAALIYLWYVALAVTRSAAHGTVTISSPYRWSVDWRLHRHRSSAPPHCCCDGLFLFCLSFIRRSPPIVHIAWNPWVSLVKSTLLRNGIRKQSVIFWPSNPPPFLLPPHLTWFTAHSLEVIMCFKPRFNPFRRVPKGVWLWLFLFKTFLMPSWVTAIELCYCFCSVF